MYTVKNYRTKRALKDAVAAGVAVDTFQPGGIFPATTDGTAYLEGPHYPEPHRWYAQAVLRGGLVIKVK